MVIFITVCVRQCVVHGAEDNYGDVSKLSTPENFSAHSFPFNIFPILDSISHEAERDTEIVKNTMENAWEQIEVKGREGYQWTQNKTEEELFNLSAPLLVEEFAANQTIHDVEDKAWEGYQWTQNKTEEEVLTLSAPLLVEEFEANQTIHDVEENVISTGEQFRDWSISTWNIIIIKGVHGSDPRWTKLGMRFSQGRFVIEGWGLHRRDPRVIYECVCFEKVNIEVIQRVERSNSIWTKPGMRLSQRRFVLEGRGLHSRVPRVIYECVCFEKVNNEVIKRVQECDPRWTKLGMRFSQGRFVIEGWGLHRRDPRVIYECVCFENVNIEVIKRVQECDPRWTKLGMRLSQRRFVLEGRGLHSRVPRVIYECRDGDCTGVIRGSFMSAYVSKKSTLKSFSEWKDPTPFGPNLECDYLKDDLSYRDGDCTEVFLGSFMKIIGAVASMVISWTVSAILICLSISRFLLAEPQIDVLIMMTTSGIGFVENIILGMILHQDIRRPWNIDPKREARLVDSTGTSLATMCVSNITIRAAMRHVFQGALHSLGVFTAAVVVSVKPEWVAADLICTILFSVASICSSIGLTKRILNVLMEGVPDGIDYEKVRGALLKMQGVLAIHNLRMWSLSMANTAVSVHLVIGPGNNVNNSVLREALKELKCRFGFFEATVQIEEFKPSMDACKMCHEFDE
ncbi:unnamed protein product [Orchesella dallaii]|uniref:Uncharacterized protein n=1 Tax=Orchesella dallaii TaxID=48710 RepID=A0ABP1PTV1_9HEXA